MVRCNNCGFLAMRATLQGRHRTHGGYHEVEWPIRENPPGGPEPFVPGESNATHQGELACARAAADLQRETADIASSKKIEPYVAARDVIMRSRPCDKWTPYVPGLDPRQHLIESNARALEEDRRAFYEKMAELDRQQAGRADQQNKHLTKVAIWVTGIISVLGILVAIASMGADALACRWLNDQGLDIAVCASSHKATGGSNIPQK